jgi:hypothetical protein
MTFNAAHAAAGKRGSEPIGRRHDGRRRHAWAACSISCLWRRRWRVLRFWRSSERTFCCCCRRRRRRRLHLWRSWRRWRAERSACIRRVCGASVERLRVWSHCHALAIIRRVRCASIRRLRCASTRQLRVRRWRRHARVSVWRRGSRIWRGGGLHLRSPRASVVWWVWWVWWWWWGQPRRGCASGLLRRRCAFFWRRVRQRRRRRRGVWRRRWWQQCWQCGRRRATAQDGQGQAVPLTKEGVSKRKFKNKSTWDTPMRLPCG